MARLLAMMSRLRDPVTGCPWDIEQSFATIAPYTIEEAYEVADAIERGDMEDLREELGDLLLQVVFHTQIASEDKLFNFDEVADGITRKMVRRHPHVFGDSPREDADNQTRNWEALKAEERAKASDDRVLSGIALNLPALTRAVKLQKRAAATGFDWPDARPVLEKIVEESAEILDAVDSGESQERIGEEVGDLLFAVVNLARHLGVDPEAALKGGNAKFTRRFNDIEDSIKAGNQSFDDYDLGALEALWQAAKGKGL